MSREPTLESRLQLSLPSPLRKLDDRRIDRASIQLYLKRDDLISNTIPGNKWRKLHYNLKAALDQNSTTLLTFGGAYSNHIRAVAAAGNLLGVRTIGIIRGEEHSTLNWSLEVAHQYGMTLEYMDRESYRHKESSEIIDDLRARWGTVYVIPEGGSNELGVRGCEDIVSEIREPFDVVCVPCGTGGTLAGTSAGLSEGQRAIGFSALKGGTFLEQDVAALQVAAFNRRYDNWSINIDYHFGGFAKMKPELRNFITNFQSEHGIELEWIYVAKMMCGIFDLAQQRYFASNSRIVAVITGPAEPVLP